jgi:hypothetical protein
MKLPPPAITEACSSAVLYPVELTSTSYSPPWILEKVAVEPSRVGAVMWRPLKLEDSLTRAFPGNGMPEDSRTLTTTVTGTSEL